MKFEKTVIFQLDEKLRKLKLVFLQTFSHVSANGWISLIRKSLGMSTYALAKKMGVNQARIIQIEKSEQSQAITLKTLEKAAAAMGCQLVYAFVPDTTLKDVLEQQAKKIALQHLNRVSHSMGLESQTVDSQISQNQLEELVKELMEGPMKKLWNGKYQCN